jgi:hypothetical protein
VKPAADASAQLFSLAPQTASWTTPHEVYQLDLDAVKANQGVAAAKPIAWRYLAPTAAPDRAVAAEVHLRANTHAFAGWNEGPFVRGFSDQIQNVAADPDIQRGDFEPRLLRVPALYIVATWLRDRKSGHDIFIPLAPANPAVEPGRHYSRNEFEAALARAAMTPKRPPSAFQGKPGTEAP